MPASRHGTSPEEGRRPRARRTTGPGGYGTNAVDPKVKDRLSAAGTEEALHRSRKDFEVELVAADPLVINPITMAMDDKGRIYRQREPYLSLRPSRFADQAVRQSGRPARSDPDGKGLKRTLVADGFADPVMGIAVKGDKLWLTANNYPLPVRPGQRKDAEAASEGHRRQQEDDSHRQEQGLEPVRHVRAGMGPGRQCCT